MKKSQLHSLEEQTDSRHKQTWNRGGNIRDISLGMSALIRRTSTGRQKTSEGSRW